MEKQRRPIQPRYSPKQMHRRLPIGVWGLGFVSMFMDISSELVHSLLPVFMATVLGTSMVTIGLIEGFAEGAAALTKVFSGVISDYCKKRKLLAVIGYALSAVTKLIFPLATTIGWVFGARSIDRIGKGIRDAPRDALLADITPGDLRGSAYGLRQALDSVGAFIGPLIVVLVMQGLTTDIRTILGIAVVPACIAVFLLVIMVPEPQPMPRAADAQKRLTLLDTKRLPLQFWVIVVLGAVFTLARFSEAFLILRAQDLGLALSSIPVIMIVMNISYALFAYPAGAAADRLSARALLLFGLAILVFADIVLALAGSPWVAFLGAAFWGLHMAFTQGLLSKLVADVAPLDLRGTAFGVFNLVCGGAVFLASLIAGSLWSAFGASATFMAGALFALLAAMGLLFYHPQKTHSF